MTTINLFTHFTDLSLQKSAKKIFKCCDCNDKFQSLNVLYKHILNKHGNNIPENTPVEQYYFNRRRNMAHGPLCVICKKKYTEWNPKTCKYHRFCSEECRKKAGELFKKNYRSKNGKDQDISDPDYQRKLIRGRRISGVYKFSKGGEIEYNSSYERHFLDYLDNVLGFTVNEIEKCPIEFKYKWTDPDTKEEKILLYIPDYYMRDFNLIIEIKDGGDNPNMHPKIQRIDKSKEKCKDAAVIMSKSYNYIKIVNKDYDDFNTILEELRDRKFNESSDNKLIISIPEEVYKLKTNKFLQEINNLMTFSWSSHNDKSITMKHRENQI